MMHSENATRLVETFEGCRLTAYRDDNGIWTIGYGHTGKYVTSVSACSQYQAEKWLDEDLVAADRALAWLVKAPVNQNEYDALVSLVFNIGQGNFASSTCLRELNQGNMDAACAAIGMWNKVAGQVSPGLVRRREAEQALFAQEAK